jgi:hypothetical protein
VRAWAVLPILLTRNGDRATLVRTRHVRFNELGDPEPIPRGADYASVIRSDVPIVVQHTRLDSRQPANALLTTMAYPADH